MMGMPSHEFAAFAVAAVLAMSPSVAAQKQVDSFPPGPLTLAGSFGSEKPGPVENRAKPVTADNPIPRRTVFVPPTYPDAAALVEARVVVSLRVTLDESGYVAEVRRVGAPMLGAWRHPLLKDDSMPSVFEALVAASTDAVKLWRYDAPKEGPITFDVTVVFAPETEPRVVAQPIAAVAVVPPDRPAAIVPIDPIDVPPVQWAEGVPPLSALIGKIVVPPKKTKHVPPAYPAGGEGCKRSRGSRDPGPRRAGRTHLTCARAAIGRCAGSGCARCCDAVGVRTGRHRGPGRVVSPDDDSRVHTELIRYIL
jgi:hypothetical protein